MGLNAEEIKYVDALKTRHIEIQNLVDSKGWKHFLEVYKQAEAAAYQGIMTAPDAWKGAMQTGCYHAVHSMLGWAEREMAAILLQIQAVNEAATRR